MKDRFSKNILNFFKLIWAVFVISALAWYMRSHWPSFAYYLRNLGVLQVLMAVGCLVCAKFLLAQTSLEAIRVAGFRLKFWDAFHIYTLSQLGKYLPAVFGILSAEPSFIGLKGFQYPRPAG